MSGPDTVPAALEHAADVFGDEEAVVDGDVRWSFAQLNDESLRVAEALAASGVRAGDRVALWSPNSARWIAASFGVYLAGAVLVPVNTRFKGMEAAHVLRRSGASVLLGSTDAVGTDLLALLDEAGGLPSLRATVVTDGPPRPGAVPWVDFTARGATVNPGELPTPRAEDLSDIIFTSGTTGAPKGAMLDHGPSVRTYEAWSDAVGLRRGDRYLCVYPFFHTAGLKSAVLACVLRGATLVPHAVFDAGVVMQRVAAERITVLPGPPTVFQSILEHP
ncbi:MAG TPA: AMP-binding protein, partial [Acidimicrobiales bacterium]|nr:AMP-binding protein [Acidimicrobiales bacterium]